MCRIIDLQEIIDYLPDAFSDLAKVTRSYIPAVNIHAMMEIPEKGFRLKNAATAAPEEEQGISGATASNGGDVAQAMALLSRGGHG
jgi:hypothetical protein